MSSVDVLIIAALKDEFVAVQTAANGVPPERWRQQDADGLTPYLTGEYTAPTGSRITVAPARPTGMGGRGTNPLATTLVKMSGATLRGAHRQYPPPHRPRPGRPVRSRVRSSSTSSGDCTTTGRTLPTRSACPASTGPASRAGNEPRALWEWLDVIAREGVVLDRAAPLLVTRWPASGPRGAGGLAGFVAALVEQSRRRGRIAAS